MLYVSIHIPKTAGTSFAKALREALEPREMVLDYHHIRDHEMVAAKGVPPKSTHRAWLTPSRIDLVRRYFSEVRALPKQCRLVHGHFPAQKYHPFLTWRRPFYITWIRDPFARAVSNYFYWQSFDAETVSDPLVRAVLTERWSLETFLFQPTLRDYQALFLQNLPWDRIDFIGVVEHFAMDLHRLSKQMQRPLKLFNENAGPVSGAVAAHEHLRARFMAFHKTDAALYQYALERRKDTYSAKEQI